VQAAPVGLAATLSGASLAEVGGALVPYTLATIVFMSIKTKLSVAVAFLIIVLSVGIWWFTQSTTAKGKTSAMPTPANANSLKLAGLVEMPKLPPAVPSSDSLHDTTTPATTDYPPGQRKEIASVIKDMIASLKAGDTAEVFRQYSLMSDDNSSLEERDYYKQEQAYWIELIDAHRDEVVAVLESLQTSDKTITPEYSLGAGGDDYCFYAWTDPVTHEHEQFGFFKRNGHWLFDMYTLPEWDRAAKRSEQP
jgi:hypothetical protein